MGPGGSVIVQLLDIYSMVVFASVIVSWLPIEPDHPALRLLHAAVEPVLRPIRSLLPQMGGLDFSPWILLILLRVLRDSLMH